MTPEQLQKARRSLEEVLGSTAQVMEVEFVEILMKNFCVTRQAFEDLHLDTLRKEPNPVPEQLLQLIEGHKKRRAQNREKEAKEEAKKQKVEADMSASILKRLILEVPSSLPPVEELRDFLSKVSHCIPVTQRAYEKLSLVENANKVVRVCLEQEDADIVTTFVSRIIESIHTTGAEKLTAYGVTKMLFDPLAQISEKIEDSLKLGLEYNKNAQTRGTFSVPHISSSLPDGIGVAKYALLLAGEEKPENGTLEEALQDLKTKFSEPFSKPHYGALPYIITYVAAGKRIQFFALMIYKVQFEAITDVIHFDKPEGRARLLHLGTNLYRLLLKMKKDLPAPGGLQIY
eukprot:TRINITY_DN4680_c0_g2_i1.p1 TRINITY_DN4680_c0_g2~~TRINITY_DN4680_c0_g2_i1.p1  ORF type:complete len:359 (-),score=88.34 TRINITY_DN4680_c0_g2_i1:304-1338(-)